MPFTSKTETQSAQESGRHLPMTPRISARYHWQDARADVLSFKESHCHAGATIPQTDIYQDPAK